MSVDYYKVLGVSRNANSIEIQKAYRDKARECHPDVVGDDSKAISFYKVQKAYEILSDPMKKQEYDNEESVRFVEKPIEYTRKLSVGRIKRIFEKKEMGNATNC